MWACPYEAPTPDPDTGKMTKCDMCLDKVLKGEKPACVASCPMRALDFGTMEELTEKYGSLRDVWPLPSPHITDPSVIITPHRDASRADNLTAKVTNREEV